MNKIEKIALFNLIVCTIALGLVIMLIALPESARVLYLLCALGALVGSSLMFATSVRMLISRYTGKMRVDERDKLIDRNAEIAAGITFLVAVVAGTLLMWAVGEGGSSVSRLAALHLVWFSALVCIIAYCLAILIQYGWGGGDGE